MDRNWDSNNGSCQRSLSLYCSVCGEHLNDDWYRHTCSRQGSEMPSSSTKTNFGVEQFPTRQKDSKKKPTSSGRSGYTQNNQSNQLRLSQQNNNTQDFYNRCVRFAEKSRKNSQNCDFADRSKQLTSRPSKAANCESSNSTKHDHDCDCMKCQSPQHSCDCAKCQAKKAAKKNTSACRSVETARQLPSCDISSTVKAPRESVSCGSMSKSLQGPRQSASFDSICKPGQPPRQSLSCSSNNTDCFMPPLSSTRACNDYESDQSTNSTQRSSSCQPCSSTGVCGMPTNSTNLRQERPSTSTKFCSKRSSISPGTRQSLMSTELNNTLFHPTPSYSALDRTDWNSMCQENTSKDKQSLLVEDTYNPGLIEDCVSGRKDFNAVSFGMFFENTQQIPKELPTETPMTLLEAFHNRIQTEREHMSDALNCKSGYQELNCESINLYFSYKPRTQLNEALSSLFKAEVLFAKDGSVGHDEEPYDIEVQHAELPLVGGCPITVDVFTGTTKPKQNSPPPVQKKELQRPKRKN